jgi:hypothetical protein
MPKLHLESPILVRADGTIGVRNLALPMGHRITFGTIDVSCSPSPLYNLASFGIPFSLEGSSLPSFCIVFLVLAELPSEPFASDLDLAVKTHFQGSLLLGSFASPSRRTIIRHLAARHCIPLKLIVRDVW